jgi:hypothetical protein
MIELPVFLFKNKSIAIPESIIRNPATDNSLYLQVLEISKPLIITPAIRLTIIGVIIAPELLALNPFTTCRNKGMKVVTAIITPLNKNISKAEKLKIEFLKRDIGRIGFSALVSAIPKIRSITKEKISIPTIGREFHA